MPTSSAFDVLELGSYDPALIPSLIEQVAAAGFSTLVIDSLSHFWNGTNGALDLVDRIASRSKSPNTWRPGRCHPSTTVWSMQSLLRRYTCS
jgi:hypothetical protein